MKRALIRGILVTAAVTRVLVFVFQWGLFFSKATLLVVTFAAPFAGSLPVFLAVLVAFAARFAGSWHVSLVSLGAFFVLHGIDHLFFPRPSPYARRWIGGARINNEVDFDPYWAYGKRP
jgi:hypothetical protein